MSTVPWVEIPQVAGRALSRFLHDLLSVVERRPALMAQLAKRRVLRQLVYPEVRRYHQRQRQIRRRAATSVRGSFLCRAIAYDAGILDEIWTQDVYGEGLQRLQRGATVVDVGAHGGFFAVLAAKIVGPSGRVVTVEPERRNGELLRTNLHRNRVRNVTVIPQALGRRIGRVLLFLSAGTSGHSVRTTRSRVTQRVRQTTVDALVRRLGLLEIDLLKIDAEAAELDILQGARATLPRVRAILAACYHTPTEASVVRAFLTRRGFRTSEHGGIVMALRTRRVSAHKPE